MNDVKGQLEAFRDLGALPPDTDLDQVIVDLGFDRPPVDPTTMTADELTNELQRIVKGLLGYGVRMPKELMLFVKNMVFLDGAIASLAPNLDLFAEIAQISTYFADTHGDRIASDVGLRLDAYELDLDGMKAAFGVDPEQVDTLTYQDVLERRQIIRERMQERRSGRRGLLGRRRGSE
jgi:ubiquinone biosynthesis protein